MLVHSGADLERVSYIDGAYLTISDSRIQRAIRETDAKILIIDPIQNFFETDMSNAQAVHREVSEISKFAIERDCAVILVGHFTKKGSSEAQYQGMGSADLAAMARSILHVRRASDKSALRYIRQLKCNIAPEGDDYAFELVDLGTVNWIGPVENEEVEELDAEVKTTRSYKLIDAMKALREILSGTDLSAIEAMERMNARGFTSATTRRAKQELAVRSIKQTDRRWVWRLPEETEPSGTEFSDGEERF